MEAVSRRERAFCEFIPVESLCGTLSTSVSPHIPRVPKEHWVLWAATALPWSVCQARKADCAARTHKSVVETLGPGIFKHWGPKQSPKTGESNKTWNRQRSGNGDEGAKVARCMIGLKMAILVCLCADVRKCKYSRWLVKAPGSAKSFHATCLCAKKRCRQLQQRTKDPFLHKSWIFILAQILNPGAAAGPHEGHLRSSSSRLHGGYRILCLNLKPKTPLNPMH